MRNSTGVYFPTDKCFRFICKVVRVLLLMSSPSYVFVILVVGKFIIFNFILIYLDYKSRPVAVIISSTLVGE